MGQELLAVIQVQPDELLELAQERASKVANYLVEVGEIDANRLGFRKAVIKPSSASEMPFVKMSLDVRPPTPNVPEIEEKQELID